MKNKLLLAAALILPALATALALDWAAQPALIAGRFLAILLLAALCRWILGSMTRRAAKPMNPWLQLLIAHALAIAAVSASL